MIHVGIPTYTPSNYVHRVFGPFPRSSDPGSLTGTRRPSCEKLIKQWWRTYQITHRFLHTPKFVLRSVIAQYSLLSQRMPAGPPQGLPLPADSDALDAPEDALPVEKDSDERLLPNFTECRMRRNSSCMTFCASSWGVKRSVMTRASMGAPSPRSICTVSAMDPFSVMRSARLD